MHLPTSPVYCSHFTLGNPEKSFFNSIIHTYIRLFVRPISEENKLLPPYPPHLKNVTALPCKMWNFIWLKVMLRSSKQWWLWKEPVVMCENWNARQATSRQVFKVTTFCTDTCFQSFSPLSAASSTTLYWNSAHVATRGFRNSLLQHAPGAVIYRVEVRTVGWPHVRTDELGYLTAQKLDCVSSMMCWHIVLPEDKQARFWLAASAATENSASI